MKEVAHAKLNLALHVRGREADGYHRIETLFAFCAAGDELEVAPSETVRLEIGGPFADQLDSGSSNLVLRAADALAARFRVEKGAALRLHKSLPVASGIGGGSADAAATLRLLDRFWKIGAEERELLAIAAGLGADVPACLGSRTTRGEGRGDQLVDEPGGDLAGTPVLLVNPGVGVSTAAVFRRWDGVDRGPLQNWREGRNDLQASALELAPVVNDVLEALKGAEIARMSGSGATCFGLYRSPDQRDAAAGEIRRRHPAWWCLATRLL